MPRSWTRLHEHLGVPPGPLTFDMVKKAAEDHLAESDDLDWKEQLPQPPRDGRWNELGKDVAAMANTRGGLLIYGVTDQDTEPVGIDPDQVNTQQYAQWIRNHVQPYLPDVTFTVLPAADGAMSFLVIDVPASPMAPHHVYGTAAKDKDQQASVVPYRDRDHTAWMAEHQIERAYRDRFTRAQHAQKETDRLFAHALENVLTEHAEPSAWFIAVARPERPLPRTAEPLTREAAGYLCTAANTSSQALARTPHVVGPLGALESVSNPRPGLRRWSSAPCIRAWAGGSMRSCTTTAAWSWPPTCPGRPCVAPRPILTRRASWSTRTSSAPPAATPSLSPASSPAAWAWTAPSP
jgi:hypothetical protein